jgi:hypothetical protein
MSDLKFTRREAINYLGIEEKYFDNYFKNSKEIPSIKKTNKRFEFTKSELDNWNNLKNSRTVMLTLDEYKQCFDFALKMAYSSNSSSGVGIRGVRSEMQMADDFVLGILAEFAVKKYLLEKYNINIELDLEVHPDNITPQDFHGITENGNIRKCNLGVAIKASKFKSCYNIIHPLEYENAIRRSDVYIFVRVGLPSDHLFRYLSNNPFLSDVKDFLNKNEGFKKMETLTEIPVWICGFNYHEQLIKSSEIPGQKFDGHRYISSTSQMKNQDSDWNEFIIKL